jgi:hypothetical protein
MSNIVAIDNFTVTSQEFVIPGGALITSVAPQAVLTISPNQGYQIEASNFAVVSSNPEVDVPNSYFTQDGENVILTVVFITTATMPNNNLDIKICMRGVSEELGVTIAGIINYSLDNATSTPQNVSYSNSGPAESTEEVLSQLIQANPGYYFQSTPTISLNQGVTSNYHLYTTNSVFNEDNRLTAIRVNADYTYPFTPTSGDVIDIYAHAVEIPVIPIIITNYSIATSVPAPQVTRDLSIFGAGGANYEVTIDNGALFSNQTNTISGIVPSTGAAMETITFPAVAPNSSVSHELQFVQSGSDLDPDPNKPYPAFWTTTINRVTVTNVSISGTVTSGDSEIIVDNSNVLTLTASSTTEQSGTITHTITANPLIPGLSISWNNLNSIPESEFTKTEDLPNGQFDLIPDANKFLVQGGGLSLRTNIISDSTGVIDMSYVLNNNIETYITKSYACSEIILNNTDGAVDSQFEYTDCGGTLQQPTVIAGGTQTVCARLYPSPTVLTGDGLIELTPNICT